MTNPLYVSYYTIDEIYEGEACGLRHSLESFGLDHDIEAIPDHGGWWRNTSYKPTFLKRKRLEYPGRPLVWLDADARVLRRPYMFDGCARMGIDVALHYNRQDPMKTLSGTVFIGATHGGNAILDKWSRICQSHPEWLDQGCLRLAIEAVKPSILRLPIEYCFIFDNDIKPDGEPVILHRQASRRIEDRKRVIL